MILQCEKLWLNSNWATKVNLLIYMNAPTCSLRSAGREATTGNASALRRLTNMWLCLQSCNRIYQCSMRATNSISSTINTKPFVILQFRMPPILEECFTSFVISSRSIRHRRCLVRQRTSVELPEKKGHNSSTFPFVNNNLPVAATKCICGNPHSSGKFFYWVYWRFFFGPHTLMSTKTVPCFFFPVKINHVFHEILVQKFHLLYLLVRYILNAKFSSHIPI